MKVLHSVDELPAGLRFVVVVGMFDGVHRGHRQMLAAQAAAARRLAAQSVVVTFDPHPESVLRGSTPSLLCDPGEKAMLLGAAGAEYVAVQPFDREFASQPAETFLRRLDSGRDLVGVVMSPETAFGRDRDGTQAAVETLAPAMGFEVIDAGQFTLGGKRVSSGRIREAVAAGRLAEARRLLGRRYAVTGTVVHGDARGRDLGFPTANLHFDGPVVLPPNGIYAVRASWEGGKADGVASLGVRPTFGAGERLLEVYLLDFDGDLYGKRMRVEFVRRQRGERKFGSVGALVDQMRRDVERARSILG
jgi:riboflavin kinase/FMN adenylyltransferase